MANKKIFEKEEIASYPIDRPVYLTMENYPDFATKLLISSLGSTNAVNYQLNYAFNDDAFTYVFGDRLSLATITGIAMSGSKCANGSENPSNVKPEDFVKFYKNYKLGESEAPAKLGFSGMVLEGYFVSMNVQLMWNREDAYTFTFQFLGRFSV
jgi:hypothetical protein